MSEKIKLNDDSLVHDLGLPHLDVIFEEIFLICRRSDFSKYKDGMQSISDISRLSGMKLDEVKRKYILYIENIAE